MVVVAQLANRCWLCRLVLTDDFGLFSADCVGELSDYSGSDLLVLCFEGPRMQIPPVEELSGLELVGRNEGIVVAGLVVAFEYDVGKERTQPVVGTIVGRLPEFGLFGSPQIVPVSQAHSSSLVAGPVAELGVHLAGSCTIP